jgi:hypothetical protein
MNNYSLAIIDNKFFYNFVKELNFNCSFYDCKKFSFTNKTFLKPTVRIIFPENLNFKFNKNFFMENLPTVFLCYNKSFLIKNNLKLLNLHIALDLPIDLFSFKEFINILLMKYIFSKKSNMFINSYQLDSNQRILFKDNKKIKLTEKELALILNLKKKNGLKKSELLKNIWDYNDSIETHTFETNLYRLRKKIKKTFNDNNFIYESNSLYYLS